MTKPPPSYRQIFWRPPLRQYTEATEKAEKKERRQSLSRKGEKKKKTVKKRGRKVKRSDFFTPSPFLLNEEGQTDGYLVGSG